MSSSGKPFDATALLCAPQILIATPRLNDSSFAKQVILLHEHSETGSKGLAINKPLKTVLGKILDQLDITTPEKTINDKEIYLGGPVEKSHGTILSFEKESLLDEVHIQSDRNHLIDVIKEKNADEFIVALGHTAWGPGQLTAEIVQGFWIIGEVDPMLILNTPVEERWFKASQVLGFDMRMMSHFVGHA